MMFKDHRNKQHQHRKEKGKIDAAEAGIQDCVPLYIGLITGLILVGLATLSSYLVPEMASKLSYVIVAGAILAVLAGFLLLMKIISTSLNDSICSGE